MKNYITKRIEKREKKRIFKLNEISSTIDSLSFHKKNNNLHMMSLKSQSLTRYIFEAEIINAEIEELNCALDEINGIK